ncbi:MAG: hypothetical protein HQM13_02940 [SAR324 cluster bacterium]|nr:hypothetical protein [SAR324 cluster bacterium]
MKTAYRTSSWAEIERQGLPSFQSGIGRLARKILLTVQVLPLNEPGVVWFEILKNSRGVVVTVFGELL